MRRTTAYLIASLFIVCTRGGAPALADSVFTVADPPVDFEVIDAEPFDGIGDNGPYYTFNDAVLGTEGEARSMAEFDISPFSVPPGEFISAATFEVRITSVYVFGLGVDGEIPSSLAVDGYVGNGSDELSDFQAGNGNVLDSIATPQPWVGQVLAFDVTSFVTALVDAQQPFVGLTVRAESFGGLMMQEGAGFPKLTIETRSEPGKRGDMNCDGLVNFSDIDPFVAVLTGGACCDGTGYNCDVNGDGVVDFSDIDPFVALLGG